VCRPRLGQGSETGGGGRLLQETASVSVSVHVNLQVELPSVSKRVLALQKPASPGRRLATLFLSHGSRPMSRYLSFEIPQAHPFRAFVEIDFGDGHAAQSLPCAITLPV